MSKTQATSTHAVNAPPSAALPSVSITSVTFSGGATVSLGPQEKVILVGPNNSGKSQALRDILEICRKGVNGNTPVVTKLELSKGGTLDDLMGFLEAHAVLKKDQYLYRNWSLPVIHLPFWNQDFIMHGLADGFIRNISAEERLKICAQQSSIAPGDPKTCPQHVLYDDDALMSKISGLFRNAFGKDLMFNFRGGSKLPIHVGQIPQVPGLFDRASDQYVALVTQNPLLDQQGDGIKGYAGILFEAIASEVAVTLIDEPEAFLHPPQMRRLGETLASEVTGQLLVATHSSDIMKGFLEGTKGSVRVLRITRNGDANAITETSTETIRELWEKPELRYSNALDGIFHEQTIICEDDSDCRVFNSVGDYLGGFSDTPWPDTAYVPTGGKHGVPKVASVLRKIGVPVKGVFDIDFLSERSLVEATVKAFGGDWDVIEPIWKRVDAAVREGIKPKTPEEIKKDIVNILNLSEKDKMPKSDVVEAMKQSASWNQVKRYGERGIPAGKAQTDYQALRGHLEEVGIYLVPEGEIENFCREVGSHGPKFVSKLLRDIPLGDGRLRNLREFVEKVYRGQSARLSLEQTPVEVVSAG
ncbi:AAA family ATPase [Burkholderia cepacia]|uniref:ATP-dependent nuclease n=1 Tax=Burkholderia cepacia TaxID=292 RepID=UPI0009C03BB2|nr:AAA family ATPase [Burkholderia cepacia]MCA8120176.1 AAA family ATPase [Burkholderia cepacia]